MAMTPQQRVKQLFVDMYSILSTPPSESLPRVLRMVSHFFPGLWEELFPEMEATLRSRVRLFHVHEDLQELEWSDIECRPDLFHVVSEVANYDMRVLMAFVGLFLTSMAIHVSDQLMMEQILQHFANQLEINQSLDFIRASVRLRPPLALLNHLHQHSWAVSRFQDMVKKAITSQAANMVPMERVFWAEIGSFHQTRDEKGVPLDVVDGVMPMAIPQLASTGIKRRLTEDSHSFQELKHFKLV
jgi:hypothetical protein